ncbi:MAG: siroheme synthase CysG [SAR324 cluster bacterium]|nr:siroheme synthase CysG [SAR324 cluster bacterium]
MEFLPLFLDLKGKPVLLVGSDTGSHNKLSLLVRASANVTVIATQISGEFKALVEEQKIDYHAREFSPSDLEGKHIVVVASENLELCESIYKLATAKMMLVNVIDKPDFCNFIFPSIVDRDPLIMAVSSSGQCPRLSRLVRAKLETLFPHSYSRLAKLMGEVRSTTKASIDLHTSRKKFWDKVFASPIIEMFLGGKEAEAREALIRELNAPKEHLKDYGQVCLVGAGPGDPDLLTLRALRLIQNADVLVYDRLVNPAILDFARREVERIYVGKKSSFHVVPQEGINQILVDEASKGKLVVRLKGGDPFIFGRGGEEIETILSSNIDFQVVPGITAAAGCGAYAGIPLTHRDHAQSVRFITGHLKGEELNLDFDSMTAPNQTLVFYMGVSTAPIIAQELMKRGVSGDMPAAFVEKGTMPEQRVITTTLGTLKETMEREDVQAPALLIIGTVVSLQAKLKWFNSLPNDATEAK